MSNLIPIPTTRVSNLLIRDRLLSQLQGDQLDIFRLQNQVSTGRRITLPSEDAPAARRAITLQRLMERKGQLQTTVKNGQSYLAAADSALSNVAEILGSIRGEALGASGTTASDTQRQTAVESISRTIEALVTTANTSFRGRYLFSGSQSNVKPYTIENGFVSYNGNDKSIQSYSDVDVLFATNATGDDVFGGISSQVLGNQQLNLQVSADTPLSSLRGGRGISPNGALLISDGVKTSTVNISQATTVGDVARLIEENPPAGRAIKVSITGNGLSLNLDSAGGGTLTVREVGSGKSASELGILETTGVIAGNDLVGTDLDPIILPTSKLGDLLGTKARALVSSSGVNNDLLVEAAQNGSSFNGTTVQFVDDELLRADAGLSAGNERVQYSATAVAASASVRFSGAGNDLILTAANAGTAYNDVDVVIEKATGIGTSPTAVYNPGSKRLTITVDDAGATTVQNVIDAVNTEGTFVATHDDSVESALVPTATIDQADAGAVSGNTGNSGGEAGTLFVFIDPGATTANQAAAAINGEGTFTAKLDAKDTGSQNQAGFGLVSLSATATAAGGSGENFDKSSGIRVVNGGQTYTLTFDSAETVEDLLNVFNGSDAGLHAEINADGTGINVRSRLSGSDFQIGENGGTTATQLGVRSFTGATQLDKLNDGVGVPTNDAKLLTLNKANIQIRSKDGQTFNVDLTGATDATAVANAINLVTTTNVTASVANGGIQLYDNTVGITDPDVTQSGGTLGIPGGVLTTIPRADFSITTRDGTAFNVDLSGATTIQDAIDAINSSAVGAVTARLASVGNGVELVDNTTGSGQLTVAAAETSQAAQYLGLIPLGSSTATSSSGTFTGDDRYVVTTSSVFTTLTKLRDALARNDTVAIDRYITAIDGDIDRVTFAHADIGAREQALELTQTSLQSEDVQLQSALSDTIDVDLTEAISNLVARQTSLQASLQTTATILKLSLLDFL